MSIIRVFSVSVLVLESVAPVKTFTKAYQKSYLVYNYISILHEQSMLCMFRQEKRMHISTISVHYQVITQNYNYNSLAYLNKNIKEQQNTLFFPNMFKTIIYNLNVFVTRKLYQLYLNNIILKRFVFLDAVLKNTSFLMYLNL